MRTFLLGLLIALLPFLGAASRDVRSGGPVVHWVADRDADRLFGLGPRLGVLREVVVRSPVQVEPLEDGGLWLVCRPSGPTGPARLLLLDRVGEAREERWAPHLLAFAADGRGTPVSIERDAEGRLGLARGPADRVALPEGATTLALGPRSVAVGYSTGELLVFPRRRGERDPVPRVGGVPGGVRAVCAAAGGGWWVLDDAGVVTLLDADLRATLAGACGLERPAFAAGPTDDGLWLFDRARPCLAHVDGAGVGVRFDVPLLAGVDAARVLGGPGQATLLVGGGGAVLKVDSYCRPRGGQGGFSAVAAL